MKEPAGHGVHRAGFPGESVSRNCPLPQNGCVVVTVVAVVVVTVVVVTTVVVVVVVDVRQVSVSPSARPWQPAWHTELYLSVIEPFLHTASSSTRRSSSQNVSTHVTSIPAGHATSLNRSNWWQNTVHRE